MRFHPDLKADRQPKALVTERRLPVLRVLMRIIGAVQRQTVRVARGGTGRRIWVYPAASPRPRPALLWIHGGGLVFGSPATEHRFCKRVARELDITVASPEYRFAPRDPYPAALDDVTAALDWLMDQPGVDPVRVAIGGDSGGGNLAAALAIRCRDRGAPEIAFQCLQEPMLDEATRHRDDDPDDYRIWSPAMNRAAWEAYLGNLDHFPPTAVPATLRDATGLPPTFIGVGAADLFHDECRAYANRLRADGVPVEEDIVEGGYHGFPAVAAETPVARDYTERMILAIRRALSA